MPENLQEKLFRITVTERTVYLLRTVVNAAASLGEQELDACHEFSSLTREEIKALPRDPHANNLYSVEADHVLGPVPVERKYDVDPGDGLRDPAQGA